MLKFDTKQHYPYSKELPETISFGELDLESPDLYPDILMYREAQREEVRKLHPDCFSMGSVDCFRVEPDTQEMLPAILYLHGGAFLFPLEPMMFRNSEYYVKHMPVRVFLPEYRLAPEHPFPAGFEDCLVSYRYLLDHCEELRIDPSRMAILGDSAGGALAAALCLRLRDEGLPAPKLLMLFYPVADHSMQYQSFDRYAHGSWSATANRHMWNMYLKNGDAGMPQYAAPLRAADLSGLPETYLEVAEMDCLCDEGTVLAERLRDAGVPVHYHLVTGAYHGYDSCFDSPLTQRELLRRVRFMERTL